MAAVLVPVHAARIFAVDASDNKDPGLAQESRLETYATSVLLSLH